MHNTHIAQTLCWLTAALLLTIDLPAATAAAAASSSQAQPQHTPRLQISHAVFDPIALSIHTTGLAQLKPQDVAHKWWQQLQRTLRRNLDLCGVFQLQTTGQAANFVTLHAHKAADDKLQVNVVVQSQIGAAVARQAQRFTYNLNKQRPKSQARLLASHIHKHFTNSPGPFLDPIAAEKKIVDRQTGKAFWQLVLLAMDGSLLKVLTRGAYHNVSPAFSRDGCSLFYTSYQHKNPNLMRMDLRTQRRVTLFGQPGMSVGAAADAAGNVVFTHSPAGQRQSSLYRLDTRYAPPRVTALLSAQNHPLFYLSSHISAHMHLQNGSILFTSILRTSSRIYMLDADAAKSRRVVLPEVQQFSARFIPPDGNKFVFVARDPQSKQKDIFVAQLPQQAGAFATLMPALTQNQGNNENPDPAPDGQLLAFISTRAGKQEIYLSTLDGNHQRRITSNGPYETLAWGCACRE